MQGASGGQKQLILFEMCENQKNGRLHGRISIECFSMIAETSKIQDLYMRPSGL